MGHALGRDRGADKERQRPGRSNQTLGGEGCVADAFFQAADSRIRRDRSTTDDDSGLRGRL
jgi:hypothetical protein